MDEWGCVYLYCTSSELQEVFSKCVCVCVFTVSSGPGLKFLAWGSFAVTHLGPFLSSHGSLNEGLVKTSLHHLLLEQKIA